MARPVTLRVYDDQSDAEQARTALGAAGSKLGVFRCVRNGSGDEPKFALAPSPTHARDALARLYGDTAESVVSGAKAKSVNAIKASISKLTDEQRAELRAALGL